MAEEHSNYTDPTPVETARFCLLRYRENLSEPNPYTKNNKGDILWSEEPKKGAQLDLGNINLSEDDIIELESELAELTLVTELCLERNALFSKSIKKLLAIMPQLERLNVSSNYLYGNACLYLAQFKRLSYLNILKSGLKSKDVEKLLESNSLLQISSFAYDYAIVDIVTNARLLALCDYNNKVRIQKSVGVSTMEASKEDYIRLNLTKFVKQRKEIEESQKKWRKIWYKINPAPRLDPVKNKHPFPLKK